MSTLHLAVRAAPRRIRIGTRGSALARIQAGLAEGALRGAGFEVETVVIKTAGDRRHPDMAWGEGAFVKEIERALLDGRVDVAVHSAKDVPTEEAPGLVIAAYLAREDPRDALVCRERGRILDTLPRGARVGTDSPRRTAFLLARRPDLQLHPLHGNVDTRLRRLDDGESDAIVLAVAGLARLGRADRIDEVLSPEIVPPAPGQGALAIQVRAHDELRGALAALDDRPTRLAVEAERAFLHLSGGGCRAPIGALAEVDGSALRLRAGYAHADGSGFAFATAAGGLDEGAALAARVVAELQSKIGSRDSLERPRVLVTRPVERADSLVQALRQQGLEAVTVPTIAVASDGGDRDLGRAVAAIDGYDWVLVTSPSGSQLIARALAGRRPHRLNWAAVGDSTARALASEGLTVDFVPARPEARGLADELPLHAGERVLLVRAASGTAGLVERLRARGATVDEVVAYRTVEGPEASREPLARALTGRRVRAVIFASGSSVRGVVRLAPQEALDRLCALPAVCIGRSTGEAARRAGFRRVVVSPGPAPRALAELARAVVESG